MPATLIFLPTAVLGHDPDLLAAGHVGHVARDREAAFQVAIVAVAAHDARVDQLVELACHLDNADPLGFADLRARPGRRRAHGASYRSGRRAARGGTCRSCRRARPSGAAVGSPRRTIGRTLMAGEYTEAVRSGPFGRRARRLARGQTAGSGEPAATRHGREAARDRLRRPRRLSQRSGRGARGSRRRQRGWRPCAAAGAPAVTGIRVLRAADRFRAASPHLLPRSARRTAPVGQDSAPAPAMLADWRQARACARAASPGRRRSTTERRAAGRAGPAAGRRAGPRSSASDRRGGRCRRARGRARQSKAPDRRPFRPPG